MIGDDQDEAFGTAEEQDEGELLKSRTGVNDYRHTKVVPENLDPFTTVAPSAEKEENAREMAQALQEMQEKEQEEFEAYCQSRKESPSNVELIGLSNKASAKAKAKFVVGDDCNEAYGSMAEQHAQGGEIDEVAKATDGNAQSFKIKGRSTSRTRSTTRDMSL